MNTSELLARNARKFATRDAIICENKRITYAQLDAYVENLAHGLHDLEIGYRDPVVLFMPNSIELAISYFAVQRVGGIVIPVSAHSTKYEVERILAHSKAKALIVHDVLYPIVGEINNVICLKTGDEAGDFLSMRYLMSHDTEKTPFELTLKEDDLASIVYTSGTTDEAKGVLYNYRNLLAVANMAVVELEMKPESKVLILMSMSHSAPLHLFFLGAMLVGATVVTAPDYSIESLLELVQHERTTHFFGTPLMYHALARSEKLPYTDISTMIWWAYGAAPMSKAEVDTVLEALGTQRLVCLYGLTETGPSGSILLPEQHDRGAGSIGKRAMFGTELRIVNEHGNEAAVDEIGEIYITGEGIMQGYIDNELETQAVLQHGWMHTGDLAKRDEHGFIWLVDRTKDIIITGGQIVYPRETEELLNRIDGVHETAVIGVPHPEFGEIVKAYYVSDEGIDAETLGNFANEFLATYKVPRRYERIDVLPRNASGKILKQVLRERQ